jgi:hypothetical protein
MPCEDNRGVLKRGFGGILNGVNVWIAISSGVANSDPRSVLNIPYAEEATDKREQGEPYRTLLQQHMIRG